jgi:hypothetical protein
VKPKIRIPLIFLPKFEVTGAFPPASRPGPEAFVDVQSIRLLAVLQKESLDYRPTDPLFAVGFLAFSHVFERLRLKPANKAIPTEMGTSGIRSKSATPDWGRAATQWEVEDFPS